MRRPIRWKILWTSMLLVFFALSGLGLYLIWDTDHELRARLEGELSTQARLISVQMQEMWRGTLDIKAIDRRVKELGKVAHARITVVRMDGQNRPDGTPANGDVVGDSQVPLTQIQYVKHNTRPEIQDALINDEGTSIRYSATLGETMLYVAERMDREGKVLGVIRVSLPLTEVQRVTSGITWAVVWAVLVALLLAILISFSLSARLTRPLEQLAIAARKLAKGDLRTGIYVHSGDEMDDLADTLEEMRRSLQEKIQSLAQEKGRFEAVLANMADGVLVLDRDKQITLVNRAAERLLGMRADHAVGRLVLEITRNYELDCQIDNSIKGQELFVREMTMHFPVERTLEVHGTPLEADLNSSYGVVLVFRDMSDQHALEQLRRDFVANVSHEMRTPLTSIRGFSETLLEGALEDPGAATRFVEIIHNESQRLTRLIDDLLSLSRLDSGRVEVSPDPVNLLGLLEMLARQLEPQIERSGVNLGMAIPTDLPTVPGSVDQLGQVFLNLLDNAIKYTPAGGKVDIEAMVNSNWVVVSIRDTGPGIPEGSLPRLFERFYRVDKARSRELGGTGLGLSIVKHIVERHGGKVEVASRVGEGSIFSVYLPLQR